MITVPVIDYDSLPASLRSLTEDQKQQLNDSLLNDDVSDNEELVSFWVNDCLIPQDAANDAIKYRSQIMTTALLHLFAPVANHNVSGDAP